MSTSRTRTLLAVIVTGAFAMTGCGGDENASPDRSTTSAPTADTANWRDAVAGMCASGTGRLGSIPEPDGTAAGITAAATATKAHFEQGSGWESLAVPPDVQPTLDRVLEMSDDARAQLDASVAAAGGGDLAAAQRAFDEGWDTLSRFATAWAIAGARCGPADPTRVEPAELTIPLEMQSEQITAGFDSIWVSENLSDRVVRLDPKTGKVQATIDVGHAPFRMQPADGSMWVRTEASYDEIDPDTNTVTRSLAKADVGPAANRSWAMDGAMWICDGQRLHRYDPTTLTATATVDLGHDCGNVWADDELVVAWSWNEDPGESGTSAASFIDPTTSTLLATVPLPVDVGGPVVSADAVFFPGYGGTKAVVVDRDTWKVSDTPEIGVSAGGNGQPAVDGKSIYMGTASHMEVARLDADTFAVKEIIPVLGVNALLVDGDSLWTAIGQPSDAVQRFDISSAR